MLSTTNTPTPFPQEPILVKHPLTGDMWNIRPWLAFLHTAHNDNPGLAAEALYAGSTFPLRQPGGDDVTASALREHYNALNAAAMAHDEITIYKAGA